MQRLVGWLAGRGFGCLTLWPWRLPASARWGARSVCPPAWRAATQMAATKAAMWAVASVTGTRAAARGAATHVEAVRRSRTPGVRELVTP